MAVLNHYSQTSDFSEVVRTSYATESAVIQPYTEAGRIVFVRLFVSF